MKRVFLLILCIVLALSLCLTSLASTPETNPEDTGLLSANPYVEAYLTAIAHESTVQTYSIQVDDEVINALNDYYEADLKLAELLRDYISDEKVLAQIAAYSREDKINAMHHIEFIYSQIKDEECISLIKEYLVRYAISSEDPQAISFFYSALGLTNHSNDFSAANPLTTEELKALKEAQAANEVTRAASTDSYDSDFKPSDAGCWAYDNWNIHGNEDFPYFAYGDCANFVSQALYYAGMKMHDDWYISKKVDNPDYYFETREEDFDSSWNLADPSPWISAKEFDVFWSAKCKDYYQYTREQYTNSHAVIFEEDIGLGDVIVLCNYNYLWFLIGQHIMIISGFDFNNSDFQLAAHTTPRQALPLKTAVSTYDVVKILCL